MADKFNEFSCEFKNESECEEELDDEGLSLEDIEADHFNEDED
jgi:hypothetical protein